MTKNTRGIICLISIIPALIISGFTISTLWNWFAVPVGFTSIGFWHAIGIDLLITYVVSPYHPDIIENQDEFERYMFKVFINPFLLLLIGYIVYSNM